VKLMKIHGMPADASKDTIPRNREVKHPRPAHAASEPR
jgi:hypothetical protein